MSLKRTAYEVKIKREGSVFVLATNKEEATNIAEKYIRKGGKGPGGQLTVLLEEWHAIETISIEKMPPLGFYFKDWYEVTS